MRKLVILFVVFSAFSFSTCEENKPIITGAERTEAYLPLIKGRNVAVVANQSSLVSGNHLVDSLLSLGINIRAVFSPEHGFRGNAEAGEHVSNKLDRKTGIEVVSLYGEQRKPTAENLEGIDIVLFDLQDVGTRFYTYISTLHYVMEACSEEGISLVILDRPNPNGDMVDGPVLEDKYRSFVGMHPIPVLHGMTIGEYALMIKGEGWIEDADKCQLEVISCLDYSHNSSYSPPVRPSPNLPDYQAIRLYPSLCFFEGTDISIGRGTDFPFKVYGHPEFDSGLFSFTPVSMPGFSLNPKHMEERCFGYDLSGIPVSPGKITGLNLQWLISSYENFPEKSKFFTNYFELLAGTDQLRTMIEAGWNEEQIRKSWNEKLSEFRDTRDKYLLYP